MVSTHGRPSPRPPTAEPAPTPAPRDLRATVLAFAAIGVIAVVDLNISTSIPGAVALGLVAPAAAGVCGRRQTVAVAFTATVVAGILVHVCENTNLASKIVHVVVVAALGMVASGVAVTRLRREDQLRKARSVAMTLQSAVLEPVPPRVPGLDIASLYMAADEGTLVGGDFYAVVEAPFGVRVLIGDVRGKGLPAVNTAAALMGSFRESAYYEKDLAEVAARLERRIHRLVPEHAGPDHERFATALLLAFDEPSRVRMVSCGHTPPVLVRMGHAQEIEAPEIAPPLGLASLLEGLPVYREHSVAFASGDVLVATTDGVTEARDVEGRFYPLQERMSGRPGDGPQHHVMRLFHDLRAHVGGTLQDDAAALVLQRRPDPEAVVGRPGRLLSAAVRRVRNPAQ